MAQFLIKHARALVAVAIAATSIPAFAAMPVQARAEQAQCRADAGAHIIRAYEADYPEIARMQGITGTAMVKVDLTATGDLANVSIEKSSGNPFLDDAALRAVRASRFAPEIDDCTNVAGSYLVEVDFE